MKYIKTFESLLDDKDNIRDMCLELEDVGFTIYINHIKTVELFSSKISYLTIKKLHNDHVGMFYYDEVKEVAERIKEYLGDKFLNVSTTNAGDATYEVKLYWSNKEKNN